MFLKSSLIIQHQLEPKIKHLHSLNPLLRQHCFEVINHLENCYFVENLRLSLLMKVKLNFLLFDFQPSLQLLYNHENLLQLLFPHFKLLLLLFLHLELLTRILLILLLLLIKAILTLNDFLNKFHRLLINQYEVLKVLLNLKIM